MNKYADKRQKFCEMNSKKAATLRALFGTLLFLFLILPFFFIWIPYRILSMPNINYFFDMGEFRYIGLIPIMMGVIIYLWCSHIFVFRGKGTPIHFTRTNRLIVKGLYKFVRNPMYIGALLILVGEALLFQSKGLLFYALVSFAALHFYILFVEEPHLANTFKDAYNRYRRNVPRWVPRLTPYIENNAKLPTNASR